MRAATLEIAFVLPPCPAYGRGALTQSLSDVRSRRVTSPVLYMQAFPYQPRSAKSLRAMTGQSALDTQPDRRYAPGPMPPGGAPAMPDHDHRLVGPSPGDAGRRGGGGDPCARPGRLRRRRRRPARGGGVHVGRPALRRAGAAGLRGASGVTVKPVFDTEAAKSDRAGDRLLAETDQPQADVCWTGDRCDPTIDLARKGVVAPYSRPRPPPSRPGFKAPTACGPAPPGERGSSSSTRERLGAPAAPSIPRTSPRPEEGRQVGARQPAVRHRRTPTPRRCTPPGAREGPPLPTRRQGPRHADPGLQRRGQATRWARTSSRRA